ncbi:baseplate multidomain protein megatron [Blastochloris sulfoviridis]|uniref:Host specificity protein n=1 Tax=Blastochloris sulfoviridis TaxID=50712 RepID=A0A5M6HVD9_9HYPH|nr:glycoside hydrolase/phage tail family protein [Blastochloris sulfoviridis]KAA5599842.1 hypothetical protein F1193_11330 [Blastochloris sulfoviridis]
MASLILSSIGGAVGAAFGGPVGAVIGRTLGGLGGGLIDKALFGTTTHRASEGPRLDDLEVMGSTEGAAIARLYGRARLAGELIWATNLQEVVSTRTETSGGKGGGSSSVETTETTYRYYANFALGLCEGPVAGIGRVWADGKTLDMRALTVRLHPGSETQEPDPLILAKQGASGAPAYRGLAYLVFERLPLAAFGNRIPQIQVEVIRPVGRLETMIRAVTLIPGATEFGYDTRAVSRIVGRGSYETENRHAPGADTDIVVSLDRLEALCPALERIALVVTWFGTDLRAGHCRIEPRVDRIGKSTTGATWSVAGRTRAGAAQVSRVDGRPAFGGTPSDGSILRAIAEMKARGLKVTLVPFVMMDIAADNTLADPWTGSASQPAYPWRGRITCDPAPGRPGSPDGSAAATAQVEALFGSVRADHFTVAGGAVAYAGPSEWTLSRMVLHCAALARAAGGVDAILVGSEFEALTRVRAGPGAYPAVDKLVALAAEAKRLAGSATKISYAANWSEYGADVRDGGAEVRFPLDPLWASPDIDMVAIDWYPPLADWRDGVHLDTARAATPHERAYLAANIRGGEAFDWFYADDAARLAQARTPIEDGAFGKPWVFRQKDLAGWWTHAHHERAGGAELAAPTAWVPMAKPIWLTELGCPAVDKGANRPSCFPDAKSSEGTLPPFSNGRRDDLIQRRVLEVSLQAFDPAFGADDATNPISPAGLRMVDPSAVHLWTWDARPHPWFPHATDVWSDGPNWETGHWLTGRLGQATLDGLVEAVLAGWEVEADATALKGSLDGYVIDRPMSARDALEPLALACGFSALETGGALVFRPRGGEAVATLTEDDLVLPEEGDLLKLVRGQESELPLEITLGYTDAEADYRRAAARSRRLVGASRRVSHADLAIVTFDAEAERLAERWLQDAWAGRETASFALPKSRLDLMPGDVVRLVHRNQERLVEITAIVDEAARQVSARGIDPDAFDIAVRPGSARAPEVAPALGPPAVHALDLPALADPPVLQHLAVFATPWPGAMTLWRSTDGASFEAVGHAALPAIVGETLDDLAPGPLWRWDRAHSVRVQLAGGALAALPESSVLDGGNAAALQHADGSWEVIQFAHAELVAAGIYRLSHLLRGQLGTEHAVKALAAGAPFVVIDRALVAVESDVARIGRPAIWRVGPAGRDHADDAVTELVATPTANALKPLAPVRIDARRTAAGVTIAWIRRTRIGGDGFDLAEVPLGEAVEAYEIDILDGGAVKRTLQAASPFVLYPAASEIADFGTPQTTLSLRVVQMSATVGRGLAAEVTRDVR